VKGTVSPCCVPSSIPQRWRPRWAASSRGLARSFLIALYLLFYHFTVSSAAKTTFQNCTYDGVLDNSQSALAFNDIQGTIGSVSWGVSIDNSILTIDSYIAALGKSRTPAIINIYFDTAHLGGSNEPLNCQVAAAKAAGAVLMLTVEPWDGLHTIDSKKTTELGQLCRDINDAGVAVFVRFAHEMNGDWVGSFLLPVLSTRPSKYMLTLSVPLGGASRRVQEYIPGHRGGNKSGYWEYPPGLGSKHGDGIPIQWGWKLSPLQHGGPVQADGYQRRWGS